MVKDRIESSIPLGSTCPRRRTLFLLARRSACALNQMFWIAELSKEFAMFADVSWHRATSPMTPRRRVSPTARAAAEPVLSPRPTRCHDQCRSMPINAKVRVKVLAMQTRGSSPRRSCAGRFHATRRTSCASARMCGPRCGLNPSVVTRSICRPRIRSSSSARSSSWS